MANLLGFYVFSNSFSRSYNLTHILILLHMVYGVEREIEMNLASILSLLLSSSRLARQSLDGVSVHKFVLKTSWLLGS
jgi:hypothetical protein